MLRRKPRKRNVMLVEAKNKAFTKALKKNGEKVQHVLENFIDHYIQSSK